MYSFTESKIERLSKEIERFNEEVNGYKVRTMKQAHNETSSF